MQARSLFALLAVALSGSALAQSGTLTIGDNAPAFKVEGWVKGKELDKLEKGKIYVIEFWATWCGPCIQSMPHLSEVAEKMGNKATVISVNTWDYRGEQPNTKEDKSVHQKRVKDWVANNDKNMRYNIAFDDANDTMANTWMRPAGQNGIPCAIIVNEEGKIAWIGHPMTMEEPLGQIVEHKYDIAAAKAKFDAEVAESKAAAERQKVLMAAAKEKDLGKLEAAMGKDLNGGINAALMADVDFGMTVLEKYADKATYPPVVYVNMAAYVAERTKSDDVKARAVKFSSDRVEKIDEDNSAMASIYHARVLFFAGQKAEALKWADKATANLDKIKDEKTRASIKKFIDISKETFNKPSGGN